MYFILDSCFLIRYIMSINPVSELRKRKKMKTVLITGAAGGLGICLAREYLSRGYMVFGVDVVQQHSETDRLFEEANGQFVFLHADVSDSSSVQHMAEYVGA